MVILVVIMAVVALASGQGPVPAARPVAIALPAEAAEGTTTAAPPVPATYWLAMSDKVRPGNPFKVSMELLKGQSPVDVQITFMDSAGKTILLAPPAVEVSPGGVKTFAIDIPLDIPPPKEDSGSYWYTPSYKVNVTGTGQEVNFNNEVSVQFERKAFSIFIQTDKGMYKPGQKVMFRVLTVFPDMRAVRNEPYDIYIKDARDNRIRQWLGVKDPNGRGVVELWLKLADEIPTGDWTIVASIMGREEEKTFTVGDYVLPRFEVEVILPPFGVSYDPILKITVKATYTFGQPVTDADVSVAVRNRWASPGAGIIERRGKLSKEGTLEIELSNKEILEAISRNQRWVTSLDWRTLRVDANVTEAQTRRMQGGESTIQYFGSPMKVRYVDEVARSSFKPGLPYTIYGEVMKQDDTLFPADVASEITVYFNVTYEVSYTAEEIAEFERKRKEEEANRTTVKPPSSGPAIADIADPVISGRRYDQWRYRTKTVQLPLSEAQRVQTVPPNGWIPLTFQTPPDAKSMQIRMWSLKPFPRTETSKFLSRAESPSDSFLQLHVGTEKPVVGQMFKVTAESTDMMTDLTYQIYAKGVLLQSTVVPARGSNSLDFEFMVTRDMTPSLSLVAFYVRGENSEVVVDALSLSTNGLFQSSISVEFSEQTAKPRDKLDVTVKAAPDSLVYLLAADKSAILLKGGNDITQDDVTQDMAEYTVGSGFGPWRYMFICGWPSPFSGDNAASVLRNAGVIFISDVLVYHGQGRFDTWYPEIDSVPANAGGGMDGATSTDKNPGTLTPAEVVRKFFPEVWLWEISYITEDSGGQVSIPVTVPDTLTTWITTGFSMHPELGLSIVEKPTELVVSRKMFVTLDLPMTIVRGENYCFTAMVFSYYNGTLPIMLTLERSDKFKVIHVQLDEKNYVTLGEETVDYSYFLGDVEDKEIRVVKFCIKPSVIGEIPVKVSALTTVQGLSDAVERIIVSKPEGVPRATSIPSIADLSSNGQWKGVVEVEFPPNTVSGSQRLEVSASGNVLGPMFENLDQLLRRPSGCGEQNMLNFAPNIFLLEFYLNTNTLTEEMRRKSVAYMLDGYQRQNNYQHPNSGYSTFGSRDEVASTWLTAFVVKCYALAQQLKLNYDDQDLVTIDPKVMADALKFLSSTQNQGGGFVENGKIFHKAMQGGSAGTGTALTAYTLIAMYEARQVFQLSNDTSSQKLIDTGMSTATHYLGRMLLRLVDPYDICLTTYALHLVDSPLKENAFNRMEAASIVDGNLKHWERQRSTSDERKPWDTKTESINIEMTAYALLVYSLRENAATEGLPVLRWLTENKGPDAGFYSTQDTVTGLQALSRVGSLLYTGEDIPITVTVAYKDSNGLDAVQLFNLDKSNELLLQSFRIPFTDNSTKTLNITAETLSGQSGPATAVVETTLRYNVKEEVESSKYFLKTSVRETDAGFVLSCSIRAPPGELRSMTLEEVDIPPGYQPDLEGLAMVKSISRVEVKGDILVIYFNTDVIDSEGVSFRILFQKSPDSALTKPEPRFVRVSDYYEPQFEVAQAYTLQQVDPSKFCSTVGVGVCVIVNERDNMV